VYALSKNKWLLLESLREFQNIVISLKTGTYLGANTNETKHISFAMKWAAKLVHHAKYRYNINRTMCQEIEFFCEKLQPLSDITWKTPIALGTAAWKVQEDTWLVWVTGGICLFQKK
jgi:hypothetical protein